MKWFKHETKRKASVKRLIMEYGIEGYGLYMVCLELIAGDLTIDNLTFELEEDAELIAHEFKMDTIKVEKIMHRCIELGLFDLADSGRIRCLELAKMLDESISKNTQVKEMKRKITEKLDKFNKNPVQIPFSSNSGNTPETFGNIPPRIEEKRIEKKRKEKSKAFRPPSVSEVSEYIISRGEKIDADAFVDYYSCKGWMVGKNKMKDWQAAARNWVRRQNEFSNKKEDSYTEYLKYKEKKHGKK